MSDTPMMRQYKSIKQDHTDAILFFRLGDFYEMFFDDAIIASSILGLTLTGRGKDEHRVPMCGIPFHAADSYITKLVKQGRKVAICEQVEPPDESKGPTKREVVRIITPGTVQLDPVLSPNESNFLGAVSKYRDSYGLAVVDISTGHFMCGVHESLADITSDVHRLNVKELLLDDALLDAINHPVTSPFFPVELSQATSTICHHFGIPSLHVFELQDCQAAYPAIAGILDYLTYTQKGAFSQINRVVNMNQSAHCYYDSGVIDHLEIFGKTNSLFAYLNQTQTRMGARLLQHYLRYPLMSVPDITARHDQVDAMIGRYADWQTCMNGMNDLERVVSRICSGFQNPTDMQALMTALTIATRLMAFIEPIASVFEHDATTLQALLVGDTPINQLLTELTQALKADVPTHIRDGGIFASGYSKELDDLCDSFASIRDWIQQLEPRLRQELDIKSLKVGYNKVFGYYIEVPQSQQNRVPDTYIRKQTLTNAERYITPDMKEKETILLNAKSQQAELEKTLYSGLETMVKHAVSDLQALSRTIAHIDAMVALAQVAQRHGLVRPTIRDASDKVLLMSGLWHPTVATHQSGGFVPNDVSMTPSQPFLLITGPNMAGKSTVMRSVALAVILGQMGGFVPAKTAEFSLVTSIYTRIGANDKLMEGQSTFMVEMVETAIICQNATASSLILLDEIGRGTSTFDGVSIAAAVTEYLVTRIQARTMFATHYHELTSLSKKYEAIQNVSMQIKELVDELVFSYKLVPGPAEKSYGVMVAKMAGLPPDIIKTADQWLRLFEQKEQDGDVVQLQLF